MSADRDLPGRRPRDVTVIRMLLLLTGVATVLNGLLEQNPAYPATTRGFGLLLAVFGLGCWWTVWRLRRPGTRLFGQLLVLLGLLAAIRVYQALRFDSALPAAGLVLPLLVYGRLRKPAVRRWLEQGTADGPATQRTAAGRAPLLRRWVGALGVLGVTVAALGVLTGAGAAVALMPCAFPTPAVGGLQQDQTTAATNADPTGRVAATDGVPLAYHAYLPANPVASLVFYHGSGANSAAGYLPLGRELADDHHIATYLVDIRGHGASGGPRGDAPTPEQVWQDTRTMVDFVHRQQPKLPLFVGGHSAGAGLVLNSLDRIDDQVAGYVLLAPDFGLHSDTEQVSGASNFATVCQRAFVVNAVSNHVLDGHTPALGFAYTSQEVQSAKLVPRYTVNMALAQNADNSAAVLRGLTKPLGVWIGAQDEVFNPARVIAYAAQAGHPANDTFQTVAHDNHLGILTDGAASIGPWIDHQAGLRQR
ncbi:alpha/beta hydrolase [Kitasatospora sp. NPDC058397]|uniref:alpha/beta hydrolase n=1 Tax=unclassified Kitasatospora TaxID=2633591 RepID=UPI00365D9E1E